MPTLQDVARLAGVSTATVSKVLSNTPYFTESTRVKVMQAVDELGYRPNLVARALSRGDTHILAVVFPLVYDALFDDPLALHILGGIESECTPHGYNILLNTPRIAGDAVDKHYQQLVESGYIEGVIALDNVPTGSVLDLVHKRDIPAVAIGYHETDFWVRSDDRTGGRQLLEHVVGLGHRQIGIIAVPDNLNFAANRRLTGIGEAAEDAGLDFSAFPVAMGDFSSPGGSRACDELLRHRPDLTALICLNDRMAMGAIQQARSLGRDIPGDLSIVGYDNIALSEAFTPPITTVDQQARELGATATRLLFEVLDGKTPQSTYLPTRLILRESSALAPV